MAFFTPLEGTALLRRAGVYTEVPLFEQDGSIYAKRGGGYVRLLSHERTSVHKLMWSRIQGVPFSEATGFVKVSFPQIEAAKAA